MKTINHVDNVYKDVVYTLTKSAIEKMSVPGIKFLSLNFELHNLELLKEQIVTL
jgi:hypothetical protein